MNCLICLENVEETIQTKSCKCTLHIHRSCYEKLLKESKIECPYCRNKRKLIIQNNDLFNLIFSLPSVIALPLWFILSFMFVIFISPLFIFRLGIGENKGIVAYGLYLHYLYYCIISL
jgi:hypothetical protein